MVRTAALIALAFVSACGSQPVVTAKEVPNADTSSYGNVVVSDLVGGVATESHNESDFTVVSVEDQIKDLGADANAASLLRAEFEANESCRGENKEPQITIACNKRTEIDKKLAALGWCYGQPGDTGPDSSWHKCKRAEPVPPSARHLTWINNCLDATRGSLAYPEASEFPNPLADHNRFLFMQDEAVGETKGDSLITLSFPVDVADEHGSLQRQIAQCVWKDNFDGTTTRVIAAVH